MNMQRYDDRETLERIKRWPNLATRFQKVRIYSGQWKAFWRGKGCGYTYFPEESDILDIDVAVAQTRHCGPEKQIQYVAVNTSASSIYPSFRSEVERIANDYIPDNDSQAPLALAEMREALKLLLAEKVEVPK